MGLKTKEISIPNYERVIHAMNESTNLDCIIAIHNTKLGPALGGVRSWSYNNFEEHLNDALRLSKAMSLKNSVCGINFGGGKGPNPAASASASSQILSGTWLLSRSSRTKCSTAGQAHFC